MNSDGGSRCTTVCAHCLQPLHWRDQTWVHDDLNVYCDRSYPDGKFRISKPIAGEAR